MNLSVFPTSSKGGNMKNLSNVTVIRKDITEEERKRIVAKLMRLVSED